MTDNTKMREDFGRWLVQRRLGRFADFDGHLIDCTAVFWEAWQAAKAEQSVPGIGEPVAWVNEYCIDEWERSQKDNWSGARLTAKEVPGSTVPLFRKPTHSITEAELERLRKDAERYRWLRDDAFKHSDDCFFDAGRLFAGHQGDSFDVAVDAAMQERQP